MRAPRMISVVGCHAEGEVGDVIIGGVLPPPGATMWRRSRHRARPRPYPAAADLRAARLGGAACQPDRAVDTGRLRCRRHHHGADGISADVGLQHHVHGNGAAGDRHRADAGARDRGHGSTCRAGRSRWSRRVPGRQMPSVELGNVPCLRRQAGCDARGRGRRHRSASTSPMAACSTPSWMRQALGFEVAPRRGARAGGAGREGSAGSARAAHGGASGESDIPASRSCSSPAVRGSGKSPATPASWRRAAPTAARPAPAPPRAWRCCTPAAR